MIISHSTRLTDGQTDRRTDKMSTARLCIACCSRRVV